MAALPFTLDAGTGARARIGLLVLATDQTIEAEWRSVLARLPDVALYEARLMNDVLVTPETLRAMDPLIPPATELLLPGEPLDVVAFGCTSATMVLGEERVAAQIRSVRPEVRVTTPVTAVLAALSVLGAKRIGVLTPYRADVNQGIRRWLEQRGLEVAAMGSFLEEDDRRVARISPQSVLAGIRSVAAEAPIEAMFVSCTSLRLLDIVAEAESLLGIPVTSSNHAMAWHALRLAGITDALPALGRLFTQPLPG